MKKNYTHKDILSFIDAAKRLPDTPQKVIYVRWLVRQFELRCSADVIKANKSPNLLNVNKYNKGD
jgi:hypothetical protein